MNRTCLGGDPLEEVQLQNEVHDITNSVFWCPNCSTPLLTEKCHLCNSSGRYCGTNFKPIFAEERHFLEEKIREQKKVELRLPENLLMGTPHRVVYNGKKLFAFSLGNGSFDIGDINLKLMEETDQTTFQEFYGRVVAANRPVLDSLERESILFIKKLSKTIPFGKQYTLFSGGKDSALLATIVRKAMGKIPLFFSNTTIELKDTLIYIDEFSRRYSFDLISEKSEKDFLDMCATLGPPSHLMRWCCTVFKSYPVSKFLNEAEEDILFFDGIRRAESTKRRAYPRVHRNKKIARQIVARPILYWPTLAVWLYLLGNSIIVNSAYAKGFTRIGCYPCPFDSKYDQLLLDHYYGEECSKWKDFLANYSKEHSKGFDIEWAKDGHWKKRKPNKKRNIGALERVDENQLTYIFEDIAVDGNMLEFLKPFGDVRFATSNSFRVDGHNPYVISGMLGSPQLRISFKARMYHRDVQKLRRQLEKSMNCVGCGGCAGSCAKGAISVNGRFTIDTRKCNHCLACVESKFTKSGCVSLSFKEETWRIFENTESKAHFESRVSNKH